MQLRYACRVLLLRDEQLMAGIVKHSQQLLQQQQQAEQRASSSGAAAAVSYAGAMRIAGHAAAG
jgi:hypothetical protein